MLSSVGGPRITTAPKSDNLLLADDRADAASEIARGTARLLAGLNFAIVTELGLPGGRRADLVALSDQGEVWLVEIKASVADFRADRKWREYRDYCDRFFFAVSPAFPRELLPAEDGLIVADRYGGDIVHPARETRMSPARRRSVTLRFARAAAHRLHRLADPDAMLASADTG